MVAPELVGASHEFLFEGRNVTVSLSSRYYFESGDQPDKSVETIARCVNWRGNECFKISASVIFVTVELLPSDGINVDEEMIRSDKNLKKRFWECNPDARYLEAGEIVSRIASHAFDYWCCVARWKTCFSYVGLPNERHDQHPGLRYVASIDPLEHVAVFNGPMVLNSLPAVGAVSWNGIRVALTQAEQPPIWIDLFHDAVRRKEIGDIRGAFIGAAVSAESYLRHKLIQAVSFLPEDETPNRRRIEFWNMTDVLKKLNKVGTTRALGLNSNQFATLKSSFNIRNSLLHGKTLVIKEDDLSSFLLVLKAMVLT